MREGGERQSRQEGWVGAEVGGLVGDDVVDVAGWATKSRAKKSSMEWVSEKVIDGGGRATKSLWEWLGWVGKEVVGDKVIDGGVGGRRSRRGADGPRIRRKGW